MPPCQDDSAWWLLLSLKNLLGMIINGEESQVNMKRRRRREKELKKKNFWTAPHEYFTPLTYSKWTLSIWCIMDINFVNAVSFYSNNVFHDVPQSDSLCGDLTSGSNDVSEVKSKFVWAHCIPLRSVMLFLLRFLTWRGQLPLIEFPTDTEADFPLELK